MNETFSKARCKELEELAGRLGIRFKDIGLLHQALTHTSYSNESKIKVEHNERLEFLGDAVLELAVSTYLFTHFPDISEGALSRSRAFTVCDVSLAKRAGELGIGQYILFGRGERLSGGAERLTNLEDAFEAIIGAIYLDQGWEPANEFVIRQLEGQLMLYQSNRQVKDYKSALQELLVRDDSVKIEYELLNETGPDHAKEYEVAVKVNGVIKGTGKGCKKKAAQQEAARVALESYNV